MKRTALFTFLALFAFLPFAYSSQQAIQLRKVKIGHSNIPMPADEPDVYYNDVSQTIIIDGTGEVEYYNVEIMSLTTFDVLISTQVNGYYDTIDISSLPDGEYVITIDAPTGNSFEGFFEIY